MTTPKPNQLRLTIMLDRGTPEGKLVEEMAKETQSRPATVGRMVLLEGLRARLAKQ